MPERILAGRYRVERHIARGGMAEVYQAHDELLDRPVALKVPFAEFGTDPTFVERFRREARAAANLNHPNIVSIFDWGEDEGTYFIVMEYVEGPTLSQVIRQERLPAERAAAIGADIALALAFAHRQGVVHRDVKPGNVILAPTGQVKVTDFGIARAGGDPGERLTQTGAVMGTATYFSPEQAQGQPLDARTDLYSLGVVLYEMVTGRPPFVGDSPLAVAYQHVREVPEPPSNHNPAVPPEFDAIVAKALAKDPEQRYATADDLRADLVRFGGGEPVVAEVGGAPLGADAVAPTMAAGRVGATEVASATAVGAAPEATVVGERRRRFPLAPLLLLLLLGAGVLGALALASGGGGGGKVDVPDLVTKKRDEAHDILQRAGLQWTDTDQPSDQPPDQVLSQDPAAHSKIKKSDKVNLTIAVPLPATTVPTPTATRPRARPTTPPTTAAPRPTTPATTAPPPPPTQPPPTSPIVTKPTKPPKPTIPTTAGA